MDFVSNVFKKYVNFNKTDGFPQDVDATKKETKELTEKENIPIASVTLPNLNSAETELFQKESAAVTQIISADLNTTKVLETEKECSSDNSGDTLKLESSEVFSPESPSYAPDLNNSNGEEKGEQVSIDHQESLNADDTKVADIKEKSDLGTAPAKPRLSIITEFDPLFQIRSVDKSIVEETFPEEAEVSQCEGTTSERFENTFTKNFGKEDSGEPISHSEVNQAAEELHILEGIKNLSISSPKNCQTVEIHQNVKNCEKSSDGQQNIAESEIQENVVQNLEDQRGNLVTTTHGNTDETQEIPDSCTADQSKKPESVIDKTFVTETLDKDSPERKSENLEDTFEALETKPEIKDESSDQFEDACESPEKAENQEIKEKKSKDISEKLSYIENAKENLPASTTKGIATAKEEEIREKEETSPVIAHKEHKFNCYEFNHKSKKGSDILRNRSFQDHYEQKYLDRRNVEERRSLPHKTTNYQQKTIGVVRASPKCHNSSDGSGLTEDISISGTSQTSAARTRMDISDKLEEENSDLKLQLNASQQERAALELEVRQKEEVIIKTQAELIRKEQAYKHEIKQLKQKLEEKTAENDSSSLKELEETIKNLKAREAKLMSEINNLTKEENSYKKIMAEYETTLREKVNEIQKVREEHETVKRHLANLELAFSDVHQKYERSKSIIERYKLNEEALLQRLAASEDMVHKSEEKYDSLKAHAKAQIEKMGKEMATMRETNDGELLKLQTKIKRLEIKNASLMESLDQKNKECIALTALCDEVTGKV